MHPCPERCSDNPKKPRPCVKKCDGSGCKCKTGYVISPNKNKCILRRDCPRTTTPRCPPNSTYTNCLHPCPERCSDDPENPRPCVKRCDGYGCQCKDGYVISPKKDKCIRREDCPKTATPKPPTTPTCRMNMVYTRCKSPCPPKCKDKSKTRKRCTKNCAGSGCECRRPYLLDKHGNCVVKKHCKKYSRKVF